MNQSSKALLWELWRPNRWRLASTLLGMLLIPLMLILTRFQQDWRNFGLTTLEPMEWPATMVTMWINLMMCLWSVTVGTDYAIRHYALPVPIQRLALFRLLPGAACCATLHLLTALILNTCFNAGWPYSGPALTYAATYLLGYSVVSCVHTRENLRVLAATAVGIISGFWFMGHFPVSWSFGERFAWPHISLLEYGILALTSIFAWILTVRALHADRKGRGWTHPASSMGDNSQNLAKSSARLPRLNSPYRALMWHDWKQDGWLWPTALGLTLGAIAVCMVIVRAVTPEHEWQQEILQIQTSLTIGFLLFSTVLPMFGIAASSHGRRSQMGQPFKTSRSTLPASDATLAWVSITNSLCSLAFSWILICGIGLTWFLAHAALYHDVSLNDAAQRIQEWTASPGAWSFPAISGILLAWYATGIGTATGLSGRTWLTYSPMWGLFIVLLIIAAIANLNQPTAEFCLIAFWSAVLVGCNLGCLLALVVGLKRRAIGARTVIASGLLLLTIESVSYFATSAHELARLGSWYWGIALLLSLVAAPPIVVPLAVHFNRHR